MAVGSHTYSFVADDIEFSDEDIISFRVVETVSGLQHSLLWRRRCEQQTARGSVHATHGVLMAVARTKAPVLILMVLVMMVMHGHCMQGPNRFPLQHLPAAVLVAAGRLLAAQTLSHQP